MATQVETAIPWTEDVEQALKESKKTARPLLLDFTAAPM
jgi:hypothetical protein